MEPHASQPQHDNDLRDDDYHRRRLEHRHHAPSPVAHWTRTLGALSPLVIGELVDDPAKRWRFIRIASVALAVLNEGSYAYRVGQERKERDYER